MFSSLAPRGHVTLRRVAPNGPGLRYHLRNRLRPAFWLGWLAVQLARLLTWATGIPTITSQLATRVVRTDGTVLDYGVVAYRVVTTAGVAALVNDWYDGSKEISNFKYHGVGTNNAAESASDTILVAECTTVLNPDSTRATGTQTKPSATQLMSTATLVFDGGAALVEHGLLDTPTAGTGVLWDRSVFLTQNVAPGESWQAQYTCTINAGG